MRLVVQRVSRAQVSIAGEVVGRIERGLVVLVGFAPGDVSADIDFLADKILQLRIFPDDEGKMNRSLVDVAGSLLVVSQFTLYGDCRKGRRPSFVGAAEPVLAEQLYESFLSTLRSKGVDVACGRFAADMQVELINDGPVTLILDRP
jgi:D-tyrosyl-tRNA(Tyr) deacylase